jgi:hypothetical protein
VVENSDQTRYLRYDALDRKEEIRNPMKLKEKKKK